MNNNSAPVFDFTSEEILESLRLGNIDPPGRLGPSETALLAWLEARGIIARTHILAAIQSGAEAVEVVNLRDHLDSTIAATKKNRSPRIVMTAPEEVVDNLSPDLPVEDRHLFLIVMIPAQMLEASTSKLILPSEA